MAITRHNEVPTEIHKGRIVDVDMANYTVSVTTEHSKKPQTGIGFATPYQNALGRGEGIYFMPEVGSLCWICFPSDGHRPFVLAWAPFCDEGDHSSGKLDLNPGDIYLGTRDDNFLVLRRGGVVQIGGGPLSQRMYIPLNNTIRDFCENYDLHTLGGNLEWSIGRSEETTDGARPAKLRIHAREFANDPDHIAFLEMGSHDQDDKTILSLTIKDSGKVGAARQISLEFQKDGNVKWDVKQGVTWLVGDDFELSVKKDIKISSERSASIKASNSVDVEGKSVSVKATAGDVSLEGITVRAKNRVIVDNSFTPIATNAASLMIWLTTHTHTVSAPGAPTSPPLPTPPNIISTKVFAD
jgi:hypothetical protein